MSELISFLAERIKELETELEDLERKHERKRTDRDFLRGRKYQIEKILSTLRQHSQNLTEKIV